MQWRKTNVRPTLKQYSCRKSQIVKWDLLFRKNCFPNNTDKLLIGVIGVFVQSFGVHSNFTGRFKFTYRSASTSTILGGKMMEKSCGARLNRRPDRMDDFKISSEILQSWKKSTILQVKVIVKKQEIKPTAQKIAYSTKTQNQQHEFTAFKQSKCRLNRRGEGTTNNDKKYLLTLCSTDQTNSHRNISAIHFVGSSCFSNKLK